MVWCLSKQIRYLIKVCYLVENMDNFTFTKIVRANAAKRRTA